MKKVRVAIIGVGNMGSAHASCILKGQVQGMVLSALCDTNQERLQIYREKYPSIRTFLNYQDLFKSGLADAVIIATPHKYHACIAEDAFRSNLHVMVEKPVDISVSAARKLNQVAKESGKVFGIMFNQRTNPLFQMTHEIVHSGQLGELKRSIWIVTNWYRTQAYYDSGNWRATWSGEGGGVLLNQAPHNLDLWQWICGMPVSLTAYCDKAQYHNIDVEDRATILANYANGGIGTFITSTGELPGTNRLEISGNLGKLVLENGILKWWKIKESERSICFSSTESFPTVETEYKEFKQEKPESAHCGILQNFTNAILNREPLLAPGYEGIHELMISNAAYMSEWCDHKRIALPFDEALFEQLLEKQIEHSRPQKDGCNSEYSERYNKRWKVNW